VYLLRAVSGDEEFDVFLKGKNGQAVMECLENAAKIIKAHRISDECDMSDIDFRQMFVKAFLHMLIGCDENFKPKAT
jgi:hypothetical protein